MSDDFKTCACVSKALYEEAQSMATERQLVREPQSELKMEMRELEQRVLNRLARLFERIAEKQ